MKPVTADAVLKGKTLKSVFVVRSFLGLVGIWKIY